MLNDIEKIEKILYRCFEKEPFHNFFQSNKIEPKTYDFGGTCSDKSMSFLEKLKLCGYDAHLHSSWINDKEIHRVVKINLGGKFFLADAGNGWPSIHLYPLFEEISYTAFGMQFQSKLFKDKICVYHTNNGTKHLLFKAFFECKSEIEILKDIANRFSTNIQYPFSGKIRFSQIVKDRFLFLKDTSLKIYGDSEYSEISNIRLQDIPAIIQKYFNFDLKKFEDMYKIKICNQQRY